MPFEELLRYTIPGYVTLSPVLLLFLLFNDPASPNVKDLTAPILGILILTGPAIGYLVHQLHMFRHERKGYADPKRRTLALIVRKLRRDEDKRAKRWADANVLGSEALLAWDYFFHTDAIDDDLRAHIIRTWYFIHSFRGISWAFGIGLAVLVVGGSLAILLQHISAISGPVLVMVAISAIIYLLATLFLQYKSRLTEQFLWPYEELAVVEHWESIKSHLLYILEGRNGDISCYSK